MTQTPKEARLALLGAAPSEFTRRLLEIFDVPVRDYMQGLGEYRPSCPLDPLFRDVLLQLLEINGFSVIDATDAVDMLDLHRTIQTSGHVTLSNGPGFFGMTWLSTFLSASTTSPCVLGAFGGVPFNNDAQSGCLNFGSPYALKDVINKSCPYWTDLSRADRARASVAGQRRISLIPWSLRHRLVYGAEVPRKTRELLPYLTEPLQQIVPENIPKEMSLLLTTISSRLESAALGRSIVFIDLCELVSRYLQGALLDDEHPLTRICFHPEVNFRIRESLPDLSWFSCAGLLGNGMEVLRLEDSLLVSSGCEIEWNRTSVIEALKTRRICPGLIPVYASLAFVNGFQCLGSFNQLEYLARMKCVLRDCGVVDSEILASVPTDSVTLGRARNSEGVEINPLDVLLGARVDWDETQTVGEFSSTAVLAGRWRQNRYRRAAG